MKLTVLFTLFFNVYHNEMKMIVGEYDHQGIYYDTERAFRKVDDNYLFYLVAYITTVRVSMYGYCPAMDDFAYLDYDLTVRLIHLYGLHFYDAYLVSAGAVFLL